jgi:hypothetical protein
MRKDKDMKQFQLKKWMAVAAALGTVTSREHPWAQAPPELDVIT